MNICEKCKFKKQWFVKHECRYPLFLEASIKLSERMAKNQEESIGLQREAVCEMRNQNAIFMRIVNLLESKQVTKLKKKKS